MADNVQELIIAVRAQTDQLSALTKGITQLSEGLAKTGKSAKEAESDFSKFLDIGSKVALVTQGVNELAGQLKNLVTVGLNSISKVLDEDKTFEDLAKSTNVSKEAVVALQKELDKLEDGGNIRGALAQLSGFLGDAFRDSASEASRQVKVLGLDLDAIRKSGNQTEEALRQISQRFSDVSLTAEQARSLALLLGEDDFPRVTQALKDLDKKIGDVQRRGQILSPDQAKEAQKLRQTLNDLKSTLEGLATQFIADLLPSIEKLTGSIGEAQKKLSDNKSFTSGTDALKISLDELIGRSLPTFVKAVAESADTISKIDFGFGGTFDDLLEIQNPFADLGEALFKFSDEFVGLQRQIERNAEFQRIFNLSLSESERLFRANQLVLTEEVQGLEARRKQLEENVKAQRQKIQTDLEAIRNTSEIILKLQELVKEEKLTVDQSRVFADEQILDVRRLTLEKIKAGQERETAERESAEEIGRINSNAVQAQIDSSDRLLKKLNDDLDDRVKKTDEIIAEIKKKEADGLRATEDQFRALENLAEARKTLETEIAKIQLQRLAAEKQISAEIEAGEKRRVETIKQSAELEKSILEEKIEREKAAIDDLIRERRRAGDNELEILQTTLTSTLSAINQRIEAQRREIVSLKQRGAALSEIKDTETELAKLVEERSDAVIAARRREQEIVEAILDQEESRRQILFDTRIRQLQREGATAKKIADETAEFFLDSIARQIAALDRRIEKLQDEEEASTELIELETRRLELANKLTVAIENQGKAARQLADEFARGLGLASSGVEAFARSAASGKDLLREFAAVIDDIINSTRRAQEEADQSSIESKKNAETEKTEILKKGEEDRLEIIEDFAQREEDLKRESRQRIRKIKKDIDEEEADDIEARSDFIEDQEEELTDFLEDEQKKRDDKAEDARQDRIAAERDLFKTLQDIADEAAQTALEKEEDFLNKRGDLEAEIAEENARLKDLFARQKAGEDVDDELEDAQQKVNDLKTQLDQLDAREKARTAREGKRQKEIEDARKAAQEKLKGAKNEDEISAIEKELEIQVNGINEKFDNEEEFEEQLARLKGKASEETLKKLKENFDKQQELLRMRIENDLNNERAAAAQAAAIRAAEIAAETKEAADKLQELKDRHTADLARRDQEHQDRINQLKDQIKAERMTRQEGLKELAMDRADALKKLEDDIKESLRKVDEALKKSFDLIDMRLKEIIKQINNAISGIQTVMSAAPGSPPPPGGTTAAPGSGNSGNDKFPPGGANITIAPGPSSPTAPPPVINFNPQTTNNIRTGASIAEIKRMQDDQKREEQRQAVTLARQLGLVR